MEKERNPVEFLSYDTVPGLRKWLCQSRRRELENDQWGKRKARKKIKRKKKALFDVV